MIADEMVEAAIEAFDANVDIDGMTPAIARKMLEAADKKAWMPIETAPKGRDILVWCPPAHGLREMASLAQWHPDAGFAVCELREPTHWLEIPKRPENG